MQEGNIEEGANFDISLLSCQSSTEGAVWKKSTLTKRKNRPRPNSKGETLSRFQITAFSRCFSILSRMYLLHCISQVYFSMLSTLYFSTVFLNTLNTVFLNCISQQYFSILSRMYLLHCISAQLYFFQARLLCRSVFGQIHTPAQRPGGKYLIPENWKG